MNRPTPAEQMSPHVARTDPHAGIGFREFVTLIAAMMAMMALGVDTMLPALPAIGESLGVDEETRWQWIVTIYLLGFGGCQLFYGPISDRYGRRPLILAGIIAFAICSAGVALAPSFSLLLLFRFLQGGSVAAVRVIAISTVRDCYAGRQMARVMSFVFIVFLAVPVLAPSIGQVVMLVFPWRGLFAAIAVFAATVFGWTLMRLPETLHPEYRRAIDFASIRNSWRIALSSRQAVGYMLTVMVVQGALFGFINSVQPIFSDTFHLPKLMPAIFAGIAAMMGIASLINTRIVERLGTRRVSHSSIIGFMLAELIHIAIVLSGHETIWTFSICQAAAMFCFGMSTGNFGALAMEPLAAVAGTAASIQGFVTTVGGALIGFVIGQHFDGTTLPMTIGFAVSSVIAVLLVLITERGKLFRPQMGS